MESSMSTAQADYALSLLNAAGGADEAIILSPFSIAVALAVAYTGAANNTKKELNTLLAKGNSDEDFHKYFAQQIAAVSTEADGYTLNTANRLYVDAKLPLKDAFVNTVKTDYAGALQAADFERRQELVNEINRWVESNTNGKIRDLLTVDVIHPNSVLMIVNAVYFKGDWASKFEASMTKPKPFYFAADEERKVDMMHKKDKFYYNENSDVQMLGLPYKGDEVRMFVFLPLNKFGLAELLGKMTGHGILSLIHRARKVDVEVQLPKFRLEKKFELVGALRKLGVKDAFTLAADFTGISEGDPFISDVIHKAFVEVNEEGTEAAAATAIGMRLRSAPMAISQPLRFIADHPFAFAIVKGDSLLFLGKYV